MLVAFCQTGAAHSPFLALPCPRRLAAAPMTLILVLEARPRRTTPRDSFLITALTLSRSRSPPKMAPAVCNGGVDCVRALYKEPSNQTSSLLFHKAQVLCALPRCCAAAVPTHRPAAPSSRSYRGPHAAAPAPRAPWYTPPHAQPPHTQPPPTICRQAGGGRAGRLRCRAAGPGSKQRLWAS